MKVSDVLEALQKGPQRGSEELEVRSEDDETQPKPVDPRPAKGPRPL